MSIWKDMEGICKNTMFQSMTELLCMPVSLSSNKFSASMEHCFPNLWLILSLMLIPHAMSLCGTQFPSYIVAENRRQRRNKEGRKCWSWWYRERQRQRTGKRKGIRNESSTTSTSAIELMYPFAEDKLHFLSEMGVSSTNQRREKCCWILQ